MYVIRGARFLWAHRDLWKYAAAPAAVSTVVLLGGYVVFYFLFKKLVGDWRATESYLLAAYYILAVLFFAALALVFFFLFARIASAISGPFSEAISRRTEELVTGATEETAFSFVGLLGDTGRSLSHSMKSLGLYLGLLLVTLPLLIIPVLGGLLYTVSGTLLAAYLFAQEYLGYPMDRRRWSWEEKKSLLRSRLGSVLWFGLVGVALAWVPIVNVLLIPSAAVGGSLLFLDLTASDRVKQS